MADSILVPGLLSPVSVMFHPFTPSRSGGASIIGTEQIVVSRAGRWKAAMTFALKGDARVLSYRVMIASLEGRAGTLSVGPYDANRPVDVNGRRLSYVQAAPLAEYSMDGGAFFDPAGWGQVNPSASPPIARVNQTPAPVAGALTMQIELLGGVEGPRPGHYFGFGERLYLITKMYQLAPGVLWTIEFWPRLREGVGNFTNLICDRPICKMQLASDDSGQLTLETLRGARSSGTIDLVEVPQ